MTTTNLPKIDVGRELAHQEDAMFAALADEFKTFKDTTVQEKAKTTLYFLKYDIFRTCESLFPKIMKLAEAVCTYV